MMTPAQAVKQLQRSERGQRTLTMIKDMLRSGAVRGLDSENHHAAGTLVALYMLGDSNQAAEVMEALPD